MNAKFLSLSGGILTVDCLSQQHQFPVSGEIALPAGERPERKCEVVRNGKPATLADLRPGDAVVLDGKPVVKIVASGVTGTAAVNPKADRSPLAHPSTRAGKTSHGRHP